MPSATRRDQLLLRRRSLLSDWRLAALLRHAILLRALRGEQNRRHGAGADLAGVVQHTGADHRGLLAGVLDLGFTTNHTRPDRDRADIVDLEFQRGAEGTRRP